MNNIKEIALEDWRPTLSEYRSCLSKVVNDEKGVEVFKSGKYSEIHAIYEHAPTEESESGLEFISERVPYLLENIDTLSINDKFGSPHSSSFFKWNHEGKNYSVSNSTIRYIWNLAYLGMLFGLGVIWLITEIMHRNKPLEDKRKLTVIGILRKVDVPTIFFFLGILSAVAALQSMGHLNVLAQFLNDNMQNIYAINLVIGVLSAIVDNVPLVAGAMGMYPIVEMGTTGFLSDFVVDGKFWQFLAYCAGTGGSILIIGSAAGVAAMGLEKIDFIWYMKKISLLALVGYLAGAGAYYLQIMVLGL